MDKIGDYIPLIIIGIVSIYSFIKKAGKKSEESAKTMLPGGLPKSENPKPQVGTKPKLKPMAEFGNQETEAGSQKTVAQKKAEMAKAALDNSIPILETIPDDVFNPKPQRDPVITKKTAKNKQEQTPVEINEITDEPQGISLDFKDIEELKKGIVYAEIFNRKY